MSYLCTSAWPVLRSWRGHASTPCLPLMSLFPGNLLDVTTPGGGEGGGGGGGGGC